MSSQYSITLNSFWLRQQVNRTGDPNRPYGHPDADALNFTFSTAVIDVADRRMSPFEDIETQTYRNLRTNHILGLSPPRRMAPDEYSNSEDFPWHIWSGTLDARKVAVAIIPSVWICHGANFRYEQFLARREANGHQATLERILDLCNHGASEPMLLSGGWNGVYVANSEPGDRPFGAWQAARMYTEFHGPFQIPIANGEWHPPTLLVTEESAEAALATSEPAGISWDLVGPGEHLSVAAPGLIELRCKEPVSSHGAFFGGEYSLFLEIKRVS